MFCPLTLCFTPDVASDYDHNITGIMLKYDSIFCTVKISDNCGCAEEVQSPKKHKKTILADFHPTLDFPHANGHNAIVIVEEYIHNNTRQ